MSELRQQKIKAKIMNNILLCCLFSFTVTFSHANETKLSIKKHEPTAIVTGANRGQGLGWTEYYLNNGYNVVATARKPEEATELNLLKKKFKKQLLVVKLDVTSEADMEALGSILKKKKIAIDIAISNAGVTIKEEFGEWTAKAFEINFRVNTMGAALFAQEIAPFLKEGAKIVQISSGAGSITYQKKSNGLDFYCMSKAGLNMLSKKLAARLVERNIIVVSMTPGGVKTDMNPTAKTSVADAVKTMAQTVDKLTIENSGTFINKTGKKMAW